MLDFYTGLAVHKPKLTHYAHQVNKNTAASVSIIQNSIYM